MVVAKITSKNQITIPAEIRSHLKIQCGDKLEFAIRHGVIVVHKVEKADPHDAYLDELLSVHWDNEEDDDYNQL